MMIIQAKLFLPILSLTEVGGGAGQQLIFDKFMETI